ncbi:MAG: RluA family pseudouridine synthase [Sphaerochaetaceae bacterium]|nr:RluA family pseudouridine synthase [Sphaerochaetaceae bacterium]MDD4006921.1 RluA family pseudouridine synthase [Sphaerochaetaceae bacterium]MDD4396432.1 RluA family pseudouridine synthase [Sphaerochaetaceae bacterium]
MLIERTVELVAGPQSEKCRVDAYAASETGISRSRLSETTTLFIIDGKPVKKSTIVQQGQSIQIKYTEMHFEDIIAQDIPLDVIYEDSDILVISKPQGMVVHPALGNYEDTLVNALAFRYGTDFVLSMQDDDDITRPGIVHRLDKDTSGVMVIALSPESHRSLSAQFEAHSVCKTYMCICKGQFSKLSGDIKTFMGRDPGDRKRFAVTASGKEAHTIYKVIRQYEGYALCQVNILTGRTHQIRVHMSYIGHSILGDPLYSRPDKRFTDASMMLHAAGLEIDHPRTGERMKFESPMPERFEKVLNALEG